MSNNHKSEQVVLYLKKNSFEVYSHETKSPSTLEFPPDLIKLQIESTQDQFTSTVEEFIKSNLDKTNQVILILSDEVIDQKIFPLKGADKAQIQKFIDDLEVEAKFLEIKRLKTDKELYCIATPKNLYLPLVEILLRLGIKTKAVVPLTIFGDHINKESLSLSQIKPVLENEELLNLANFPYDLEPKEIVEEPPKTEVTEEEIKPEEEIKQEVESSPKFLAPTQPDPTPKLPLKHHLVHRYFSPLIFIVIMLIVAGVLAAPLFSLYKLPWQTADSEEPISTTTEPSPTIIPSPQATTSAQISPTVSEVEKSELKLRILNGSGVTGQAAKLKKQFEDLGYETISTGNSSGENAEETVVSFSSKVTKPQQDEIIGELENTFTNVTVDTKPITNFDIQIITGTD